MAAPRGYSRVRIHGRGTDKGPTVARVIVFANQKGGVAKDDDHAEPRRCDGREGDACPRDRPRPPGQPDDCRRAGNPDEIERSMFDVLVHKLPISEIIRTHEIDVGVSSIDPGRCRARPVVDDRPRERAPREGARRGAGQVRLHPDRHARRHSALLTINAFYRRPTGVIVPVQCEYLSLRGLVQLEKHAFDDPGEPQSAGRDPGNPSDDVRQAPAPLAGSGSRS